MEHAAHVGDRLRAADPVGLLTPDGALKQPEHWPPDLVAHLDVTADLVGGLYRWMRLTRRLDAEAFALQRHGELGLWAPSLGQEAAQVGSITALRDTDQVFPSYREHALALYRGATPEQMLQQWRGMSGCGWDPAQLHLNPYSVVLGAHLPHATGYAMGVQRDGSDEVVVAYFGDGATSQGDVGEAFNWAAACAAPVLFFCQNNQYAISTPTHLQMLTPVHQRARGFGLESFVVDGNDVLAVHAVTKHAVSQIRSGSGPALIEAVTYRMGPHTSSDDPSRYRDRSESDSWTAKDPLTRVEKLLEAQGWLPAQLREELDQECDHLGEDLRRACRSYGQPDLAGLFDTVLARRTAALDAQKAEHTRFEAGFDALDGPEGAA